MRTIRPAAALAAFLAAGCATADPVARRDAEALRVEFETARADLRRVESAIERLSAAVDVLAARRGRPVEPAAVGAVPQAPERAAVASAPTEPSAPLIPGGLQVVRIAPAADRAPTVPTSIQIVDPDPGRLDALPSGPRDLAAASGAELRAARRQRGLDRAHALEDFVSRYPHHPEASGALVESATAYAEAGRGDAACALAGRVVTEYPAGDAVGEAMLRLAACDRRRGDADAEERLLTRLVREFPGSAAGRQARDRLAAIAGGAGGDLPAADMPRSAP